MEFKFFIKNLEAVLFISVSLKILIFLGFDVKPYLLASIVLFSFSLAIFNK